MKTENARRFADLEAQHERARAWENVSSCLRCCADGWPEYLTVDEIAFLHARGEGGRTDSGKQAVLADYLGRCLEYDGLSAERIKRRERVPSELGMGDDPETWFVEREVIRARGCAHVLAGLELGPYLQHWLAPYLSAERLKTSQVPPVDESERAMATEAGPAAGSAVTPTRETQADRLEALLKECEGRAAKLGEKFECSDMPGQKAQFFELMRRFDPSFKGRKDSTLGGYVKGARCKWSLGAKGNADATALYSTLFPEAYLAEGGVIPRQDRRA